MKRILFAFATLCIALVSCQKKETLPTVSFQTALPVVSDGTAILTIDVTGYSSTEAVSIPLNIQTDAEEGSDYEISAKEFVVGGSAPVTSIRVTPLKYGTGKVLNFSLNIPSGFAAGKYTSTTYTLSDKIGYISFASAKTIMTETATVTVNIFDGNGNQKRLENKETVKVTVNKDESTAVEGTHFRFADSDEVLIDQGKSSGSIALEIIGDAPVSGKDLIVLDLEAGEKFNHGQNIRMQITILGSAFNKTDGTWKLRNLDTDAEYFKNSWYIDDSDYDTQLGKFPVENTEDSFTINLEEGTFTPDFKSGFKNYFTGVSNVVKDKEITEKGIGSSEQLQMLKLDNVNRYFSETQKSEDKEALIAIKMTEDADSKEDLLKLYIIDYQPKDFLTILEEWGMIYPDNRPTAVMEKGSNILMSSAYMILTFGRAE